MEPFRTITTNEATPTASTALNFLTGAAATTSPYYLYGILKDISYNYGLDADFTLSPQVSLFAEYSREHNYRRMISRNRTPADTGLDILTCVGCDTANNDWESTTPEKVDIWTVGADTYFGKKVYLTTYYSLTAGHSDTLSRFLGINGVDPSTGTDCSNSSASFCRFLLVGTRLRQTIRKVSAAITKLSQYSNTSSPETLCRKWNSATSSSTTRISKLRP